MRPLLDLFRKGRANASFEAGIQLALQGVLTSPKFLFRVESDPPNLAAATHRVSSVDLASRLSFFLWSSIPDQELLDAAAGNQLGQPAVIERQVRRMLGDPRAQSLAKNFGGQWLHLRNLAAFVPTRDDFPEFDDALRQAMRTETEMLLDSLRLENRSVLDLLRADYTFANERLARHYGMRGVYGSHFRRVPVADPARFGLLGHASVLAVTSYPNRTSPVVRGKWILENLVGTPPPPPPPGRRQRARGQRARQVGFRAGTSGRPPRQPAVRVVPSGDGSARVRARELRRCRRLAHRGSGLPDRRRPTRWSTAPR